MRFGEERMDPRFRNNALNSTEASKNRQSSSTELPSDQLEALSEIRGSRAIPGPTSTFPNALVPNIPAHAIHGNSSNLASPNQIMRLTPDRSMSQESQMNYAVNRQLALSSLKSNIKAIKFDGKDKGSYSSWKIALELETQGLFLSDVVWLEVLQLRTTEVALQEVKRGRELALVDTSKALQYIWDNFNKNYGQHFQLADVILKKLQTFSIASLKKPQELAKFSGIC